MAELWEDWARKLSQMVEPSLPRPPSSRMDVGKCWKSKRRAVIDLGVVAVRSSLPVVSRWWSLASV